MRVDRIVPFATKLDAFIGDLNQHIVGTNEEVVSATVYIRTKGVLVDTGTLIELNKHGNLRVVPGGRPTQDTRNPG